jgi:hypothetical protein
MPDIFITPSKSKPKEEKINLSNISMPASAKKDFGFLTAFALRPRHLRYESQESDEKIILFLRRHFVTNVGWIIMTFCLAIIPFFAFNIFSFASIPFNFQLMIVIGWYLLTFANAFERFLSWFFNIHIVTNERIIDVNFPSILYKDISECRIENVEDLSSKIGGFIRSFLNYGDVLIQTAGTLPEISFEAIPNPDKAVEIINDLIPEGIKKE